MGMAEYIEREALEVELNHRLNFLMGENGEYDHYTSGFDDAVTRVENFPAADVAPVRHGHWELTGADKYGRGGIWKCTGRDGCGKFYPYKCDFCPNCGAKMDGGVDDG